MMNLAKYYWSILWLTQIGLVVSQIANADEAIEPSATLKAEVVGPRLAGMPLEFQLTITNTGKEPFHYWCGGPGTYPGAQLFRVEVTDKAGKTWTLPLTNGQYEQGSGSFQSIRDKQTLPAVCDPLPEGTYTLKVSRRGTGSLRDEQKILAWPAMTAKPVTIEITDDPVLLKKIEKHLLITAETHPFATHVAKRYSIDPVVQTWLNQLLEDDWQSAKKYVGHLRHVRRLPPGGDKIIKKAVAKHVKHPPSNGRDNFLRNLSIAMRGIGSDGCIEAMVMIIQSDLPPDAEDIFRHEVVSDLAEMSEPGAEKALLELAKDKSSPIYWSAICGLALHHNHTALKPLLTLIQSGDERKRAGAARALWGLREIPEAKAALEKALNDPDPTVRIRAKHALTSEHFSLYPPF